MNIDEDTLKEAVIKLGLPISVYIDASKFCANMKASKTHHFAQEVIETASIYLATKVNEQYRRLRGSLFYPLLIDILNVVLFTHKQEVVLAEDGSIHYVDYKDNLFKFYSEISLSQVY